MDREVRLLEFNKIRDKLSTKCFTPYAKEKIKNLEPSYDKEKIRNKQRETSLAKLLLEEHTPPFVMVRDIKPDLTRANKGGVLLPESLLQMLRYLEAWQELKMFFLKKIPLEYSYFIEKFKDTADFFSLISVLDRSLEPDGKISSNASATLGSLRKRIASENNRVRESLEKIVRSTEKQKYLQDAIVTIRNNRHVVPVKQEYRAQMKGIVHDRSSSGATLFIEPLTVVETNNRLNELKRKEEEEIERLLRLFSDKIATISFEIDNSLRIYAEIDYIFARGRLSNEMRASEPDYTQDIVDIRKAKHPLISGEVVPISIRLGEEFKTLVITGPNTGGKTVSLKTLGLFAMMGQSGLHIPASPGSSMVVFESIFADIGDEQSLEQSLSTFSGHMENIVNIVSKASKNSLVLLDELGAGTDPSEGAALAMALLNHFNEKGVYTLATTHYSELKAFAFYSPGMENASVEFDVKTLSPTFKLSIGIPGRSNAFAIASRLGLSSSIIDEARKMVNKDELHVDDMVKKLLQQNEALERDIQKSRTENLEIERIKRDLLQEKKNLENSKTNIIKKAREEAFSIVKEAREEMDKIVKETRQEIDKATINQRKLQDIKEIIKNKEKNYYEDIKKEAPKGSLSWQDLKEGKTVKVINLDQKGSVVSWDKGSNEVIVQVGIMKITTELANLLPAQAKEDVGIKKRMDNLSYEKSVSFPLELDVRGLTSEEALGRVSKYLDDALLANTKSVLIIHGKGTGKLRNDIQILLAKNKNIANFQLADRFQGGSGATLVNLSDD